MSNFQVRGCCCGVPFGCGVLVLALLAVALWKLVMPGLPWPSGAGRTIALTFLAVPGVVLLVRAGAGAPKNRRR
jgi:hypothetical protein